LPSLDHAIAGVDIRARYAPAGSVAGDFYDVLSDGHGLGILIADVSGHGLPSALIASMLQVALTGQAGHATEPAKVLLGLNRALCGKFTQNFVTAAYIYVDLESNLMRYAGAGHPPMLQWRNSTGKAAQVLENGLVLGLIEEASYEALEFLLEPGDRYVLYTDGILEAANSAQEQFGADRLMSFIKNHKHLEAEPFSQTLLNDLAGWSNQTVDQGQQDDITLLVIDYKHH
jgi:serine phosphatase RsbU (regulator of sigma subunit)